MAAAAVPGEAVQKAVEALKEGHGKPTDREVAAGVTAAVAASSAVVAHSKTAVSAPGPPVTLAGHVG